jgi:hypothetical protein
MRCPANVCVDRVDPEEIVDILTVDGHGPVRLLWMIDPGVDPRPLQT